MSHMVAARLRQDHPASGDQAVVQRYGLEWVADADPSVLAAVMGGLPGPVWELCAVTQPSPG